MPSATVEIPADVLDRPVASFLPPTPRGTKIRGITLELDDGGGQATVSYVDEKEP